MNSKKSLDLKALILKEHYQAIGRKGGLKSTLNKQKSSYWGAIKVKNLSPAARKELYFKKYNEYPPTDWK